MSARKVKYQPVDYEDDFHAQALQSLPENINNQNHTTNKKLWQSWIILEVLKYVFATEQALPPSELVA